MNVGLMQMHAFVAIIEDILSSHDKNQIHVQYTTNHTHVHIDCERDCDYWALRTVFSKRESKRVNPNTNTMKTHSLF